MTFDDAMVWVERNTGAIINDAKDSLQCSPYDTDELVSCANEAAVKAVFTSQESKGVKFEQAFWNHYRSLVREMIPYVDNHRSSPSIPSSICIDLDFLEDTIEAPITERSEVTFLSEAVFWAGYDHLSPIERRLLYNLLGLGSNGYHTIAEAGNKVGIAESSASEMFKKVRNKLARAFSLGLASLDDMPSAVTICEYDTSLDLQSHARA